MAVDMTLTPDTTTGLYKLVDVEVTGLEVDTEYVVVVRNPSGNVRYVDVMSDGSGDAACDLVANERGEHTVEIRPKSEFDGSTTAADTVTIRGG